MTSLKDKIESGQKVVGTKGYIRIETPDTFAPFRVTGVSFGNDKSCQTMVVGEIPGGFGTCKVNACQFFASRAEITKLAKSESNQDDANQTARDILGSPLHTARRTAFLKWLENECKPSVAADVKAETESLGKSLRQLSSDNVARLAEYAISNHFGVESVNYYRRRW